MADNLEVANPDGQLAPKRPDSPMALPIYLVAAPGCGRDAQVGQIGAPAELIDSVEALGDLGARLPGVILVDAASCDASTVLALADRVSGSLDGWTLAVIEGGEGASARSVSFGPPASLQQVGAKSVDPNNGKDVLLELTSVLKEVAKARHDINNPLTAALAEVQILLMDVTDQEVRESLEITQQQLRKIRDLLAATGHIRLPAG